MRITRTASLRPLRGRSIAVIGYGSQGRAQALNLRDSGFAPLIGLPSRSTSRRLARKDGFRVVSTPQAVTEAEALFLLAPDHLHGRIFDTEINPQLRAGQILIFAHASSIHFQLVKPPSSVGVILIAPLGPGQRLRELAWKNPGVSCFFAIQQDPNRNARAMALALARAIGCLPAGAIETTFADEAVGDLFGEQAVLCGGLGELLMAGVATLTRHGLSAENAYLECVYQLDLIVDLIKEHGLAGMYERISPTAAYGARHTGPRVIGPASRRAMDVLYREIATGTFFRRWVRMGSQARSRGAGTPTVPKSFSHAEARVLAALGESSPRPKR